MSNFSDFLLSSWLSETEANIFSVCLRHGSLSSGGISKYVRIPRTTIDGYVQKMTEKWYLETLTTPKGRKYKAISFDSFLHLQEREKKQLEKKIQHTQEMKHLFDANTHTSNFPYIKTYEWNDCHTILYERFTSFNQAYSLFNIEIRQNNLKISYGQLEKLLTTPKWSQVKELWIDSPLARVLERKLSNSSHQIKLFPLSEKENFDSDSLLIDGVYYHFSFGKYSTAVEIKQNSFCKTWKIMFEKLRENY